MRENPERNVIPMMDPSDVSLDIQILTFSEGVLDVFWGSQYLLRRCDWMSRVFIFTYRVVGKVAIVMAKNFLVDLYQQNVGKYIIH